NPPTATTRFLRDQPTELRPTLDRNCAFETPSIIVLQGFGEDPLRLQKLHLKKANCRSLFGTLAEPLRNPLDQAGQDASNDDPQQTDKSGAHRTNVRSRQQQSCDF